MMKSRDVPLRMQRVMHKRTLAYIFKRCESAQNGLYDHVVLLVRPLLSQIPRVSRACSFFPYLYNQSHYYEAIMINKT